MIHIHRASWSDDSLRLARNVEAVLSDHPHVTRHDEKFYVWRGRRMRPSWELHMFYGRELYKRDVAVKIIWEYRWDKWCRVNAGPSIRDALASAGLTATYFTEYDGMIRGYSIRVDQLHGAVLMNLLRLLDLYDQWVLTNAGPLV